MNHRIQTFPTDFVFKGSKTDQEQMIGNAVPVNLARFVGSAIVGFMSRGKENFAYNAKVKEPVLPLIWSGAELVGKHKGLRLDF